MASGKAAPNVNIPHSDHTVSVSIIDSTTRFSGLPWVAFMNPPIPGFNVIQDGVSWSFLIKHQNGDKQDVLLFDLGARKDFENSPKAVIGQIQGGGVDVRVEKTVYETLKEHGDDPASVNAIIWSHYHFDHTGNPAEFPPSTALIVGPGFKQALTPGFPSNQEAFVDERAWAGRELREISFDGEGQGLKLGEYKALDFFGDGSFYLIDCPGHATGHMCALARTSADPPEFILLGGDVANHGGVFRPTEYKPLPENISPSPLEPPYSARGGACPGSLYVKIHPKHSTTEPFTEATGFLQEDPATACAMVKNLFEFDAQDSVFPIIAHDRTLLGIANLYPKTANDWKKKGWKEQAFWRFLADYDTSGQ